jgi:hypothetical protein
MWRHCHIMPWKFCKVKEQNKKTNIDHISLNAGIWTRDVRHTNFECYPLLYKCLKRKISMLHRQVLYVYSVGPPGCITSMVLRDTKRQIVQWLVSCTLLSKSCVSLKCIIKTLALNISVFVPHSLWFLHLVEFPNKTKQVDQCFQDESHDAVAPKVRESEGNWTDVSFKVTETLSPLKVILFLFNHICISDRSK